MLSTSLLWGRFWCSWTNRKWPKLISDCDNSATTGQLVQQFSLSFAGTHQDVSPMHHQRMWASSLAVIPQTLSLPPANRVKFNKKFYTCSDVTHTHLAYSEAWFWKSFAGGVGNTPVRMNLPGASIQVVLISLRREIRFHLKYLDRVVEAHAINHPPSFVDFPRCRSSRQSVWKLFG